MTAEHARSAESRAVDHWQHGRHAQAREEYQLAAQEWRNVAAHMARHGETLISDLFTNEARKCDAKADRMIWESVA